jgi:hypothetical protein
VVNVPIQDANTLPLPAKPFRCERDIVEHAVTRRRRRLCMMPGGSGDAEDPSPDPGLGEPLKIHDMRRARRRTRDAPPRWRASARPRPRFPSQRPPSGRAGQRHFGAEARRDLERERAEHLRGHTNRVPGASHGCRATVDLRRAARNTRDGVRRGRVATTSLGGTRRTGGSQRAPRGGCMRRPRWGRP